MGSIKVFKNIVLLVWKFPHLNAGKGEPWAGHKRANIVPTSAVKTLNLSFILNLGPALPIGSMNGKI